MTREERWQRARERALLTQLQTDLNAVRRALDEQASAIRQQVERNSRNLDVQFVRIAEIQAQLDKLLNHHGPKFQA